MKNIHPLNPARKAFTLIELLVVIAIIAILAAILFPVFAAAREKARQSTCASNEKQLGLAIIQYTQDYDETLPPVASRQCIPLAQLVMPPYYRADDNGDATNQCGLGGGKYRWGWIEAIYPYVKSKGVLTCPSDPGDNLGPTNLGQTNNAAGPFTSYGMNRFLGWFTAGSYDNWGTGDATCLSNAKYFCGDGGYPAGKIARPSDIVLLCEYGQERRETAGNPGLANQKLFYAAIPDRDLAYNNDMSGDFVTYHVGTDTIRTKSNHSGQTNVLFADGHVKSVVVQGDSVNVATNGTWLVMPGAGSFGASVLDTHWHPDAP